MAENRTKGQGGKEGVVEGGGGGGEEGREGRLGWDGVTARFPTKK